MKRLLLVSSGLALALSSVWVAAQDSPESLLPPGFEKPKPKPAAQPAVPSAGSTPVVQPVPGSSSAPSTGTIAPKSATLPSGARIPTVKELESMSPDQLDELLGLKPKYDMPAAARRSMCSRGSRCRLP